tara:strand:+ start:3959 stop:4834 length:876 start_codon:yes stop_codon:yes gene_type:complete
MATNVYFSQKVSSEQNLYEDIVIESLKMYGQDVFYLPRDKINEDTMMGEDILSSFNSAYKIEMYVENTEGFDGEGDLFTKFGVEIRDTATFIVARRRWLHTVKKHDNEVTSIRPLEGDVIYLPMSKTMFQIMAVEHEQPFYQLQNLPTYKLRCEIFEYSGEKIDVLVPEIDAIQGVGFTIDLTLSADAVNVLTLNETITQSGTGYSITAEIVGFPAENIIRVSNQTSSDGNFHTFATGTITGSANSYTRTITVVDDFNESDPYADNELFTTDQADMNFLDFSESNPFGDVN